MERHGLTTADLETEDVKALREMLRPQLAPRELSKSLLLFSNRLRLGDDLRQIVMVCALSCEDSPRCLDTFSASLSCFPDQASGSRYAVLLNGEAFLANVSHCLAVQGLQPVEVSSFNVCGKSPERLMAALGGGFVPNVCFAFLPAALVAGC